MPDLEWIPEPHTVPVERNRDAYHAQPYTPPAATFFPPLLGRIDETMRERLTDLYGSL